ncbi:hypothetical protein M662_16700 [Bacillus sp. SB49]|uniref:hypothetical protein n=1 Tax=Bacillus sp. SB49 TaxID=1071080 RepID=UPI000408D651|nr:hypothetical protein [Bacillus sp. SB49]QHT48048.1 hypothetical protein M662_16700 [Bacillus sp. SB49]
METIVYVFVIALFIVANVYAVKWQRDGSADLMISGVLIMIGGILVSITAGALFAVLGSTGEAFTGAYFAIFAIANGLLLFLLGLITQITRSKKA